LKSTLLFRFPEVVIFFHFAHSVVCDLDFHAKKMGNANCYVNNQTNQNALVLTFNNADTVYSYYKEMYRIK
jgi:hypothetical protein